MENRNVLIKQHTVTYALIIGLAILSRIMPHPDNFAPIGALALFSGHHFSGKIKWALPLAAMFLSDMIIGFDITLPFVYGSFLLIVLLGSLLKKITVGKLAVVTLGSSILFFLVTNFGVWLLSDMYAKTIQGLTTAYIMGIPFFRNTVLGDFFFSYTFFYGFQFVNLLLDKISFPKILIKR